MKQISNIFPLEKHHTGIKIEETLLALLFEGVLADDQSKASEQEPKVGAGEA